MFRALFPSANHTSTSVEDSLVTLQVQSLLFVIWKSREKGENEGQRRFFLVFSFFVSLARTLLYPFSTPTSSSPPPSHSLPLTLTCLPSQKKQIPGRQARLPQRLPFAPARALAVGAAAVPGGLSRRGGLPCAAVVGLPPLLASDRRRRRR
jgi:hypothetical protein